MEKASSACRRLRHLLLPKRKPDSVVAVATSNTQAKFQNVVEKFKKLSNSGGFRAQRAPFKAAVRRLSRAGHFSHVEDILQHQKKYESIKNEHFTARLIHLYGQAKMLDHALQLFDEMPKLNCPRTVFSFNTLLSACFPCRNFDKAIELFRELPAKLSIEPNAITYTSAMKAFCKTGSFDDAVSLLDEMAAKGVGPDAVTFSLLLGELYHSGRYLEGENAWNLMREKGVDPDVRCYNSRVQGMVSEKKMWEAVALVREMEQKGLRPNSYTYNVLIKGFVDEGNVEEVKNWYAALQESSSAAPDIFTYLRLVPFALDCIGVDLALELCKNSAGLKKKLPVAMVRRVSDELLKHSRVEDAKHLLHLYTLPHSQP
ncbi:pentatricopeptide repeat-containing protein At3g13160, mitochondrial-like [Salvia miltiorrhiza]|uniref:pentatricopeptide repeat-containing protein At3g13160, mitochondrial-like n=1 Tax=Salvia miltiorrhiza TaxID=226208 RepID=UPI0025AD199D|nr:pentatricopeptide repeat-containing protein At3g13160, mitochondrial-like [Salvia miltiorrhiza]